MKKIGQIGLGLVVSILLFGCSRPQTPLAFSNRWLLSPDSGTLMQTIDPTELTNSIETHIAETLVENGPGVAVLVMENGEILHAQGYGFSNVEAQLPMTTTTVFDLASVSKQMTALGILILMEAGTLNLEDAVTKHLPDFIDPNPDNPIAIADLLHHTSGLADYTGEDWELSTSDFAELTLEDHLLWLNQQEPHRDRDTEFEYNNSGYALLALIIQRVTKQPFADFMADAIFEPLGMSQTLVYRHLGQTIPQQAQGYAVSESGKVKPSSFPSVIAGDGNVFSSIADLAKYDRGLRRGTLVSPETLALAFTPGASDPEETDEAYGFGWAIAKTYVHHSGSWEGTSTYYRFYLDSAVTIVVLSNDENYDPEALVDAIAADFDWQ
jgi:CubicO group peptidase (beta-lactamase class C family)